jgi:serine/threonine-protein kinase
MAASETDRNLLFAVTALQLDILEQSQFAEACSVWALTMDRPMEELLQERGWITAEDHQEIAHNIDRKLKKHRGDVHASLAAAADSSVREVLRSIDQPAIRQSVDELPPATGHVLTTVILDGGSQPPSLRSAPGSRPPSLRYTLSSVHGEGGLGRVWLARDTELNRNVALKEVRLDRSADVRYLRRFLREAQVTGQLEHPNIVPVYELARRMDDDQPFYTMRFVQGRTLGQEIARFHTDRAGKPGSRLDWQRRLLEPFVKICEAIGYAHSRNVIHRDLKPENVVLGDHGEVIVLDWGLAKVLTGTGESGSTGDDPIEITTDAQADQTHGPVGTPAYMAPEQVEADSDKIDTRTDLYGLGAILFHILTNHPPGRGGSVQEVLQNITAGRIPRAREVESTVPAALEAICARALLSRREDRYQTPSELADDVRRWMIDEPVSVYRDPLTVRLTRWGRKHRTLVTSAAAVLLVAAASFAVVASERTAHANAISNKNSELTKANTALDLQRRRAEANEAQAIAAVKAFGDAIANEPALKSNPALEDLRTRLLKEPHTFFRALHDRLQADRDTRPESLERLAGASSDLGVLTNEIGNKQDALAAFQEALAIFQTLADANPTVTRFQSELARSHHNIGVMLSDTSQSDGALKAHRLALAISQKLADANPTVTQLQCELARSHHLIGATLSATGQPAEALKADQLALAIFQKLADANPNVSQFQSDLARSHNSIGLLLSATGRPAEALKSHKLALAIRAILAAANPTVTQFQSDLANSHNSIGLLLSDSGQPAEALKSHRLALATFQNLAAANPTVTQFQRDLAHSHNCIGELLSAIGQPAEALKAQELSLGIAQRLAAANPTVTQFQSDLAISHNKIGDLLSATGQPAEALKAYQSALAIRQSLADADPSVTQFQRLLAISHDNIGNLMSDTGQSAGALKAYLSALAIRQALAREHPESPDFLNDLGGTLNNLAWIDLHAKRFMEARDRLREAAQWQRKALKANPANPIYRRFMDTHLRNLIEACQGLGDAQGAAEAEQELAKLRDSDPAILALDARLTAILKGEQSPRDNTEQLQLARRAYAKGLHAAATHLMAAAFRDDPKLADDRQTQLRYNAACAAALAVSGASRDDPAPDDAARAKLREQAHNWLEAELAVWSRLLESANVQQRAAIARTLQHWQEDTDLTAIRDPKAIDALPEAEREGWRTHWKNVASTLARAREPSSRAD